MIQFKSTRCFLLSMFFLNAGILAQYVYPPEGIIFYSGAYPADLLFHSNPSLTNTTPLDDESGSIVYTYSANKQDGHRHFAKQIIREDGSLTFDPENAFISNDIDLSDNSVVELTDYLIYNTSLRTFTPNPLGGFNVIANRPSSGSRYGQYYLQRFNENMEYVWPEKEILISTSLQGSPGSLHVCDDGTSIILVRDSSVDPSGNDRQRRIYVNLFEDLVSPTGKTSPTKYLLSEDYSYGTSTIIPSQGNSAWLLWSQTIDEQYTTRFNKIYSDGSFLFEIDTSKATSFRVGSEDFKNCQELPDGGLILMSLTSMQIYSNDGEPRWTSEETVIQNNPFNSNINYSVAIVQTLLNPADSSIYLLISDYSRAINPNHLYSVMKVSLSTYPKVLWTKELSRMALEFDDYDYHKEVFGNTILLIENDFYYCFADTIWKIDSDGNYVWGRDGKYIDTGSKFHSEYVSNLYRVGENDLLLKLIIDSREALIRLDSDGNFVWQDTVTFLYPDRVGDVLGMAQLSDGRLRLAHNTKLDISITDYTPIGKALEPAKGRKIIRYKPYMYSDWIDTYVKISAGTLLFNWELITGQMEGKYYTQWLNENLTLLPENPTIVNYYHMDDCQTYISDEQGGFYVYSSFDGIGYDNFSVDCIFEHIYADGSSEWGAPVVVFPEGMTDLATWYAHIVKPDNKGGYWFVAPYDSTYSWERKRQYIQHLLPDGSLQFDSYPEFPFGIKEAEGNLTVTQNQFMYFTRSVPNDESYTASQEIFLTDDNLNPLWEQPVQVFDPGIEYKSSYGYQYGYSYVSLYPGQDDAVWVICAVINSNRDLNEYYAEIWLQLIDIDGQRILGDEGIFIGQSNDFSEPIGIVDNTNGLWILWEDHRSNIYKALYINSEGELKSHWENGSIKILARADANELWPFWINLQHDNSLLVAMRGYHDQVAILQRLAADQDYFTRPSTIDLVAAYPNPFNSRCRVQFELSKPSDVNIRVYDLTGREVHSIVLNNVHDGKNSYSIDASDWSAGVYLAQIETSESSKTVKMVVVR